MDSCFNFLINVDQCLNMSRYDMFFYELENKHRFHVSSVQLEGNPDSSLETAAREIRMYLNKFPGHVSNYRIVVCMRQAYQPVTTEWRDTTLYRLLSIYYALQDVNIHIKSRDLADRALHMIVLLDTDMDIHVVQPKPFDFDSDFAIFCRAAGLEGFVFSDVDAFALALTEAAEKVADREPLIARVLYTYLTERMSAGARKVHDEDLFGGARPHEKSSEGSLDDKASRHLDLMAGFGTFVKAQVDGYEVSKKLVDSWNWKNNVAEQFRIVEYLNRDLSTDQDAGIESSTKALSTRCLNCWEELVRDKSFFDRYAGRLKRYEKRLMNRQREMAGSYASSSSNQEREALPSRILPGDIKADGISERYKGETERVRGSLKSFLKVRKRSDLAPAWKKVKEDLERLLSNMDSSLEAYASALSRNYQEELQSRGRAYEGQWGAHYRMDADTEDEILRLQEHRRILTEELARPQMSPSLRFQDRLNLDSELKQADADMSFYLQSLSEMKGSDFLRILFGIAGAVFLHYILLHVQAFSEPVRLLCMLGYAAAAIVLMLMAKGLPEAYYRMKIAGSVRRLDKALGLFLNGYFAKADNFCQYINNLNRLDEVTRRLTLLTQVSEEFQTEARLYDWHKVQVRIHLEKARYFSDLFRDIADDDKGRPADSTFAEKRLEKDVVGNPIYWP